MLSPRERECLVLAFQGLTARESSLRLQLHRTHHELPPGQCDGQAEGRQQDGGDPARLLAGRDLRAGHREGLYCGNVRTMAPMADQRPHRLPDDPRQAGAGQAQGSQRPPRHGSTRWRPMRAPARAAAGRTASSDLQAQAQRRDISPLRRGLARLGEALPRLDFGLLQPRGWWARATGKGTHSRRGIRRAVRADRRVAQALAAPGPGRCRKAAGQACGADRALLEFEVEFRAIDKIIDQGTRWLQDMRNQLKVREAAGQRRCRPAADQG